MTDKPQDSRNVRERIIAILDELPAIGKDQRNPQQGFMFRGHDDILNALNPLLAKHGVFVVPDVIERVTAQRTTKSGAVMYEVNLHVRFVFYGPGDGDIVVASTWGEGTDSGDKATNKAMTMAFKNVLNQTFAISSAEFGDTDAETPEETTAEEAKPPTGKDKATKGQMDEIAGVIRMLTESYPEASGPEKSWKQVAWLYAGEKLHVHPSGVLTKKQANDLREWLEKTFRDLNEPLPSEGADEDAPLGASDDSEPAEDIPFGVETELTGEEQQQLDAEASGEDPPGDEAA